MSLHHVPEELRQAKEEIANDKLPEAIKILLRITNNHYYQPGYENRVILISQTYHENRRRNLDNTISDQDFALLSSKNVSSLLEIIDEIQADIQRELERKEKAEGSVAEEIIAGEEQVKSSVKIKEKDLTQAPIFPVVEQEIILKAKHIEKKFRKSNFSLSIEDLELKAGALSVLVGENATGKTTLLRILAGELAQDSGDLRYPFFADTTRFSWSGLKNQIAYIPQFLPAWHQDLYSCLCYEGVRHGIAPAQVEHEVDFMIHRMGLGAYLFRKWSELSGGYKLRFSLARALLWRPRLLLLDEPLAHLDVRAQLTVLTDLKKIISDRLYYLDTNRAIPNRPTYPLAILLCSQHIHEVEPIADQILFMRAGKLERPVAQAEQAALAFNHFELSCNLDQAKLKDLLQHIPCRQIRHTGISSIVTIDSSFTAQAFLRYLEERQVVVHAFRDISQSIMLNFYED